MSKKQRQITSLFLACMMSALTMSPAKADEVIEGGKDAVPSQIQTDESASADSHYQEAIGFLSYLGIFTGYEDGDMRPEETITRAELSAIILRLINVSGMATYKDGFTDVDSSHWAANVIQTAYDNAIINGMGDGTFAPDDNVTYEQAVKMVMCAINYEPYAAAEGGYPLGYISLAAKTDVDKNASGIVGEAVTRRTVAKLVYNALTAEYPVVAGMDINGMYTYETREGVTILSETRDIYYTEGIITATPSKSIDFSVYLNSNQICVEDEIMESEMSDADDFVAEYSRIFYRDTDGSDGDKTALYAVKLSNKTQSVTITDTDIHKIVTGYEGGNPVLEYYDDNNKIRDIKIVNQPVIVYNDQPFTLANYASVNPTDSNGNSVSFDEFITPEAGEVKAVDFGKDGTYDILFVENYEISVVRTATVKRLQLEYPVSIGSMIKPDTTEDPDLVVKITRDGEECKLNALKAGDVVCIKMNANFADDDYTREKYITIEAVTDYVEGTVSSVSDETEIGGECTVIIDGEEYQCIANDDVIADVRSSMGTNTKFSIDKFGRIAYVQGASSSGLSSGEKYGWLLNVYTDDSGESVVAKIYTQEAAMENISLASKIDYWAPNATENETKTAAEIDQLIGGSEADSKYFLQCDATDETVNAAIRLCKYRVNSKGEITRLYLAVDGDTVGENSKAVRIDTSDHKDDKVSSDLFAGKYLIENPVAQFSVPLLASELNETDAYKYRYASEAEFNVKSDSGLGYNCFFADINDYQPAVAIKFIASAKGVATIDEYNTSDDNPVFVLDSISVGVDDDDETVYILKGFRNGETVEYTATEDTLVVQVNPDVRLEKEIYDTTQIWDGDSGEALSEVLHEGDVIGVEGTSSNAAILMRFVDAKGLSDYVKDGGKIGGVPDGQFRKDQMFSSTRDRVIFGYVTDTSTSPIVQIDLAVDSSTIADEDGDILDDGSSEVSLGISSLDLAITVVNIGGKKPELNHDFVDAYEIEEGDYVFMRRFKNDAVREIYVFKAE